MSGNDAFILESGHGWSRGLNNMLRIGLASWFKTRSWWVHCLIWGGIIGFILAAVAFSPEKPSFGELVMLFGVFIGLFPAVGVTIVMQDAIVSEKREGTAAWVLSKPVTRPAFVISKVIANTIGVLVTMVVVPGIIAYAILSIAQKSLINPLGFLEAMLIILVNHFFFLSLTLLLGTLFAGRGPVIGIPLAVLFFQQNLIGLLPALRFVLPWTLVVGLGNTNSLAASLMTRTPVQSEHLITLLIVLVESLLFILIGLFRFNREDF